MPDGFNRVEMRRTRDGRLLLTSLLLLFTSCIAALAQSEEDKLYARAVALEKSGDMEGAAAAFAELYEDDPMSRVFFDGVVRTYAALGRFEELREVVNRRIDDGDDGMKTRLLLAELLHRSGDQKGAMAAWKKARETGAKDLSSYDLIAESYIGAGLVGEAVRIYEEARRQWGRSFELNRKLGSLYLAVGDVAKGVNEFIGILDQDPGKVPEVIGLLAPIIGDAVSIDEAITIAERHVEINRDAVPYRRVFIWLLVEKGEWKEALTQTEEIDRRRDANGSELFAFGDRMRRAGRYDAAISAFTLLSHDADTTNPLIGSARLGIALSMREKLRASSNVSDAEWADVIEQYDAVVNSTRSTSAKLDALEAIAEIEAYERGRHDVALALLDDIDLPLTITESFALVEIRADIHLLQGNLDSAVVEYRRFIDRSSAVGHGGGEDVTDARLRLAELYLFEGKIDEGIDSLKSLADDPSSDAMNDALEWLMIVEENRSKGDSLLGNYLAGIVAVRRGDWEEVDVKMTDVFDTDRRSSIADDALYHRASALLARGRRDEGRELFERIVTDFPTGTHADRALIEWARSFEEEGNVVEAERIYLRLLSEYPYSIEAGKAREGLRRIRTEGS